MYSKRLPVVILSFGTAALLTACGLEGFLSPNPGLNQEDTAKTNQQRESIRGSSTDNNEESATQQPGVQLTKRPKTEGEVAELPPDLPFYPQSTLETITPDSTDEAGVSIWQSPDDVEQIVQYYDQKWQSEGWQVVEPFLPDEADGGLTATVDRDNARYRLKLVSTEDSQNQTELTIAYEGVESSRFAIGDNAQEVATKSNSEASSSNSIAANSNTSTPNPNRLADYSEVPEPLQQYVADVAALNVVTFKAKDDNGLLFEPNETITRRQYAKWLVKANNKYYANSSGSKIRLAGNNSTPAFKDVSPEDPNFAEIQGLAEAGLIPSVLTGDTQVLFKPDAPLTREDLIAWKVPLDLRKGLPTADSNAVKETWGFQDLGSISPETFPALFADYQNGDRSNLKRVFGYTTLFQPKKTVTRAEAAASLWYFGSQGDGVTALEVRQDTQ